MSDTASSDAKDTKQEQQNTGTTLPQTAREPKKDQPKDVWDKFSTLSTLLSTILIATLGGFFTHRFEERQAEEQKKIQETQTVAQLMPYLTGTDQQQRRAFIAVKVLGNTKLMVELASSDPQAPGPLEALRDAEFNSTTQSDRDLAIKVLSQFEFAPSCSLPFREVAISHPIDYSHDASDRSCGMAGDSPSDGLRAQNLVKNNFCAGTDFRDLSSADFLAAQQQVNTQILRNVSTLPVDRGALKSLGEGSAVRFTGYIMNAHYANLQSGESVNCKVPGQAHNAIHVALVSKVDEADPCQSITAQISPHMRPLKWEADALTELAEKKTLVRIGGQLMYDASHVPCGPGIRSNPARLTTWEIHPVYSIEICPTAQKGACPKGQWVPLAVPAKD